MNASQQKKPSSKGKRSIGSILAVLLLAALAYFFDIDLFTNEEQQETKLPDNQIPVELVRTIDGDTIKIIYEGEEVNVRYLLIDTPEIDHKDSSKTEPFALEATARNDELLKSGQVTIEFDVGDRKDRYDRLLAYIYVDGKSVQKTLLEEGYARVAYVFEPNTTYEEDFKQAENEARNSKRGVWEKEGYVTNRGFNPAVYGLD